MRVVYGFDECLVRTATVMNLQDEKLVGF
uniref:Uncharacterized protein n=1 Tax=Anguilla anguilla TaxID=7936 RepID=A0A0E9S234_ANGAN